MWQLQRITAKNICTFKALDYVLYQDHATLIFGNNQDNDSQNSNGSGKSAMLEAIAIALTGTTLRKVDSMDDIINDAESECSISAKLTNAERGEAMTINRLLSRKNPQQIQIIIQSGPYDTDTEEIVQPTVNDYNKWILETIGLSKDEIFGNFILSRTKFQSFLTSSDKEKKEIINRFSNGIIVDESIAALHEDMAPIQKEEVEAEKTVAERNGRVSALATEIENTINTAAERNLNKQKRIEGWKQAIAEKREDIRNNKEGIKRMNDELDKLDEVYNFLTELEGTDDDITSLFETIKEKLNGVNINISDYNGKLEQLKSNLSSIKTRVKLIRETVQSLQAEQEAATKALEAAKKTHAAKSAEITEESEKVNKDIEQLGKKVEDIRNRIDENEGVRKSLTKSIALLEQRLAGVIVCPKCKHEFTLTEDLDIERSRQQLTRNKKDLENVKKNIADAENSYNDSIEEGKKARKRQGELDEEAAANNRALNAASKAVDDNSAKLSSYSSTVAKLESEINQAQHSIDTLRNNMFDEAYDAIDKVTKQTESAIDAANISISSLEGAIKTYEESIQEAENNTDDNLMERLKESKHKHEQDLAVATKQKEEISAKLAKYQQQEATFMEFKTHLANTKINAIAQITNEFLEVIGSDMRISFSGYTVLKSGKVRDKISISLLRNGVDCGAFGKLSQGEQARIQLATILAMWKLCNVNCDEGKGLNLIVIDEILDASDEMGLANVFAALNKMQITSLVVSHGNVAEGYQHKLVVTKQNGVSCLS